MLLQKHKRKNQVNRGFMPITSLGFWLLLVFFTSQCDLVGGDSTNSVGPADLNRDAIEEVFESEGGAIVSKSIAIDNDSGSQGFEVYSVDFLDNKCGDFSYRLNTKASPPQAVSQMPFRVAPGTSLELVVTYTPSYCEYTDYQTILRVTFQEGTSQSQKNYILLPKVNGLVAPVVCDSNPRDFTYTQMSFSDGLVPPAGEKIFLKVDQMAASMNITLAPDFNQNVGTEITVGSRPYEPTFFEVDIGQEGTESENTFLFKQIDRCTDFVLPSPLEESVALFLGQDIIMTSPQDYQGRFDSVGNFEIENFRIKVRVEGLLEAQLRRGTESPLPDSEGTFQVSMLIPKLTTKRTNTNNGLINVASLEDGSDPLPIQRDRSGNLYLSGASLNSDGTMTLVGLGTFLNDDESFVGSETVQNLLVNDNVENVADREPGQMYIELKVSLWRRSP